MEYEIMKKFVDILHNNPNRAYGFISCNYTEFSKFELKEIILELLYVIHGEEGKILLSVGEELKNTFLD